MQVLFEGVRDKEFQEKVLEYLRIAENEVNERGLSSRLPQVLRVNINNRMRTNGGTAHYREQMISLNYRLLSRNSDKELQNVTVHELAHLFVRKSFLEGDYGYLRRVRAHGKQFQRAMRMMGQAYSRCHRMDVKDLKAKHKRYDFKCGCPERNHAITKRKARNFRSYVCKHCSKTLRPANRKAFLAAELYRYEGAEHLFADALS